LVTGVEIPIISVPERHQILTNAFTCPVIQTIGVESICAAIPVTRFVAQDLKLLSLPTFPVALAYPCAA
jgi:hypothetical protein